MKPKKFAKFKSAINAILDFLVPPNITCIYCGREIGIPNKFNACDECLKNLPFNNQKICRLCGAKIVDEAEICLSCFYSPPPFSVARAPFLYDFPISGLISNLKFENAKFTAAPLAQFMIETYRQHNFDAEVVIPVPLTPKRQKERKYNQAELLAQEIAKEFGLELLTDVAARSKHTAPQARLNWRARQENMRGAFTLLDKSKIKGKKILVVDDVFTTGATIKSFCRELQKAKPKNICVLTLAHTYIDRVKLKNMALSMKIKYKIKMHFRKKLALHQKQKLDKKQNNI